MARQNPKGGQKLLTDQKLMVGLMPEDGQKSEVRQKVLIDQIPEDVQKPEFASCWLKPYLGISSSLSKATYWADT